MEPEFGSSFHLAKVLLAAMNGDTKVRAAINIKYSPQVDAAVQALGFKVFAFDRADFSGQTDDNVAIVTWSIEQAVNQFRGIPDVLINRGEYGIEPTSYVFGYSAVDSARKTIQIVKSLFSTP